MKYIIYEKVIIISDTKMANFEGPIIFRNSLDNPVILDVDSLLEILEKWIFRSPLRIKSVRRIPITLPTSKIETYIMFYYYGNDMLYLQNKYHIIEELYEYIAYIDNLDTNTRSEIFDSKIQNFTADFTEYSEKEGRYYQAN